MEHDQDDKCLVLLLYIFSEGFSIFIDISRAHDEYYRIHEKCPEPDRARMDTHPIECHGESIETERDKEHTRTRIYE